MLFELFYYIFKGNKWLVCTFLEGSEIIRIFRQREFYCFVHQIRD